MTDANLYGFMLAVSILLAALAVDRIVGEYPASVHPVVWIGTAIGKLDPVYRKIGGFLGGFIFVVTVEAIFIIPLYAVIYYLTPFVIVQAILMVFFLKATFSIRGMNDHVRPIISALESGDIESARKHLSMVVRRDTSGMESGLICSAAIETVSEGFVDGVLSPLFYFSIFGLAGALFFRIANTFDSNIAYKDARNFSFGKFAAILDTILNYIPARLSALVIYSVALAMRIKPASYDMMPAAAVPDSTNAGWPIGSMSNCLGVRLEKKGEYVFNPDYRNPGVDDVKKALSIFTFASYLSVLILLLPLMIFIYTAL